MKSATFKVYAAGALCAVISAIAVSVPSVSATSTPNSSYTNTTCVDGSKRSNLSVTWNSAQKVTIHTAGNKPLCADTTVFFSSYTMPDNYNGQPFKNNPTASPQSIFDSKSAILKKGTAGATVLTIGLPESCKNIQVDVYYAPEIKTVTAEGHGKQYITGKIIAKTQNECKPVVPEVPTPEAQTPPTPAPEVKVTPAPQPEALPETGLNLLGVVGATTAVAGATYAAAYTARKRQ